MFQVKARASSVIKLRNPDLDLLQSRFCRRRSPDRWPHTPDRRRMADKVVPASRRLSPSPPRGGKRARPVRHALRTARTLKLTKCGTTAVRFVRR